MNDFSIDPLLRIKNPDEQRVFIENLFSTQVEPLVRRTIRTRIDPSLRTKQDEEDISGESLLRLWRQVQKWFVEPDQPAFTNFPGYVASITINCCREHFRTKFPRRWHLRNRLRYVLSHSAELHIWKSPEGNWLTGFSSWVQRLPMKEQDLVRVRQLTQALQTFTGHAKKLEHLVQQILRIANGPLLLDDLLAVVMTVPGIREQFQDIQVENGTDVERLTNRDSNLMIAGEHKDYLERLWIEICALPLKQRAALLLNLRDADGYDVITIFPATSTANLPQIAEALQISIDELAELWNDLPLDDNRIAKRLDLTRQQVINLRKSARERLAFRMKRMAK